MTYSTCLTDISLIKSVDECENLQQLVILKLATNWLEKQSWLNTAYGGLNPVHEFLFETQLMTQCFWEELFIKDKKIKFHYDALDLKNKVYEMSLIDDDLKIYLILATTHFK